MKKNCLSTLIASTAFLLSINSFAAELKTSSLAVVKTQIQAINNNVVQQCQKLFKEGDKLILEAAKQPGTHIQVKKMRDKLSSSKQQILKMDSAMQQKSCNKGLVALNSLKQKY